MVAELAAISVLIVWLAAETLHSLRTRRIAMLVFGPSERPAAWALLAPLYRTLAAAALCWGLVSLLLAVPQVLQTEEIPLEKRKHLLLLLDVSPSMRLVDAGPTGKQSRMQRAADVVKSLFDRIGVAKYRVSVVAFYSDAKPVVIDTTDSEIIHNILHELPMHHGFLAGETDILAGIHEAFKIAKPWQPRSTTVVVLSDGDTVPATGMPKPPASVSGVLVLGVGDESRGSFINGRQSRQDTSSLRQVALRLGGAYENTNAQHVRSATLRETVPAEGKSRWEDFGRREYALLACAAGSLVLAFLPLGLHLLGTRWRPGRPLGKTRLQAGRQTVNWRRARNISPDPARVV